MIRLALAFCVLAGPAFAEDTVEAILAEAKADCASLDKGVFDAPTGSVTEVDLTGDGKAEMVVDASKFICSTSASYWGGTGGSQLSLIVAGKRQDFFAQEWKVIAWNNAPVLLLWLNGGECGGAGADPCIEALVWSDFNKAFMSVRPAASE
ncbi:hypothetical protein GCM10010873_37370 [Cypionkella aquatica]|uniref:Uncharacterized protein n=1 Tax=Cypionkella aquatica TaxID=1756042 RepID=A0AA37U128_9RHOB|nr:hypothetical protein [Cypionkella aquatica]GLS88763.1 hypothetical protein GCM10010873_37370 [Cypionkella aquatica]